METAKNGVIGNPKRKTASEEIEEYGGTSEACFLKKIAFFLGFCDENEKLSLNFRIPRYYVTIYIYLYK